MNKIIEAVNNFDTMNCYQSVFAAFGPDYGVSKEMCFKLGLSFGGGMGKQAKTCGVVTGAYTVIGLWSAKQTNDKAAQKQLAVDKVREFNEHFIKAKGSLECNTLLKFNMSIAEELKQIEELDLFNTECPKLVEQSTEILEKILY